MSECLSEDALTGLLAGGLVCAEQEERWHAHIEGCAACYELLRALAAPSERAGHFASSGHSALRLDSASVPAAPVAGAPRSPAFSGAPRAPAFSGTPRFALLRHLGTGGMGRVYEVLDRDRGARVALKLLRRVSPDTIAHLKREFRALQDLSHPSLVTHLELVSDADQWFLTMELVEGQDLLSYLRGGDPVPRLRACLLQLAHALSFLHRAGMLHCDIKPANVLVRPDGHVVLVDLSLTTAISAQEHRAAGFGTLPYAAPEQLAAGPLGPAADWYSVGALLYEALCGQRPFRGSPAEILRRKQEREPPPPSSLAPDVPPDLDALCAALLRRRPEDRPGADEVLRILAPAGALPSSPQETAEPPASPPFVGRAAELQALRQALALRGHGPACVLLEGDSGVGKSALLRRFAEEVRASEPAALVLATRCYEREAVPYKALDGAMDALARHLLSLDEATRRALLPPEAELLALLFPAFGWVAQGAPEAARPQSLDAMELRLRVFSALRRLLRAVAQRGPLVLLLDDLQWTDGDSLALLRELLRPPEAPALLLVASRRPRDRETAATDGLAALAAPGRRLHLAPLPPAEAEELARSLLGEAGPASAVAAESGGHPLYIQELARHAEERGAGPTPPRLQEALLARIGALPADAAELLGLISLAGMPLAQETASAATGQGPEEFLRGLSLLRAARLLRTGGARARDAVEPYHDRVREAVLGRIDPARRRSAHRRLALALEAGGGASAEALAIHHQGAGDVTRAADYAARAAREADQALAFERAARLYRLALELDERASPRRPELQRCLAEALANAGRSREAGEAFLLASDGAAGAAALELRRRAAEELLHGGHFEAGVAALRKVLSAAGMRMPTSPRQTLVSMLWRRLQLRLRGSRHRRRGAQEISATQLLQIDTCWVVGSGLSMVDPMLSMDFLCRHNLLALRSGDRPRAARALCMEAILSATTGADTTRSWRLVEIAKDAARESAEPQLQAVPLLSSAVVAFYNGQWRRARELGRAAEEYLRARAKGEVWELEEMQYVQYFAMAWLGETAELVRWVPELLRVATQRGHLRASISLRTGGASLAWLAQDDAEGAMAAAQAAMNDWGKAGFDLQRFFALITQAEVDLYRDQGPAAHQRLQESWPALRRSLLTRVAVWRIMALDLRARSAIAAACSADRAPLLHAARRDARRLGREASPWALPLALRLRAACAAAAGDRAAALSLLDDAARGFDIADMALHAAAARYRRGQLLGGDEGRALTTAAEGWMSAQGVRAPARMAAMLMPGRSLAQPP